MIFFVSGFPYRLEVGHFLKGLDISYLPIFFSVRSDSIKSVKKKIKKNMEKLKMFFYGVFFLSTSKFRRAARPFPIPCQYNLPIQLILKYYGF